MKILHLLSGGGVGGIEILCRDIARLSKEQHEFCFLYSGGSIAEEMKQCKVPVYFLYKQNMLKRISALIGLVKREKYDVIIVHHEGIGIYSFYLILSYIFKKIRFTKYLHCSFDEKFFYQGNKIKDMLNYWTLRNTLKRSDKLVAVSEYVKMSYCNEFNFDPDNCIVIYNGILISEEVKKSALAKDSDSEIKLLFIGRLVELKGVRILLQAVKKIIDSGERVSVDILGDGPERENYQQLVRELRIDKQVCFHGQQLEKQGFFDKADIFVCPSICQEAFGISIVEAMSQGKICVASKSGGIPEIIDDGINGYLFDIADVDSLVENLKKAILVMKSAEYDRITASAKKRAAQFDIYRMIEELQKVCR